jgi:hypothetical protein
MVETHEGWLVLLITVYYLGIGNANQTDLNTDGGFESLVRFIGLANLSLTTQNPNPISRQQQVFAKTRNF